VTNPLLDPNVRLVIAHRGNRIAAPENTLRSLQGAVDLGADAIEFDVRLTRDGVPVLMHDAELDRTTDARGRVSSYLLGELERVNAGARFPGTDGNHHPIPTLEEVLDTFRATPMVIEVKERRAAEPTELLVRRFGLQMRVLIGSAERGVMEWFYRTGLPTCASMLDAALLIPVALLGLTPSKPRYDVLSLTPEYRGFRVPIPRMVRAARRVGVPTQVWTVNDPKEARFLWAEGVSGIVTDDPAGLLRARAG
jgi:glycerophosphoryl diester phosphodiesterase